MFHHRLSVGSFFLAVCSLLLLATPLRAADPATLIKRFKEANAKLEAGDNQGAIEIYNEIIEASPTFDNPWVARAVAKWRSNDKSGARADFAQAIKLNPGSFQAYGWRAKLRFKDDDFRGSADDADAAIKAVEARVDDLRSIGNEAGRDQARTLEAQSAELYAMRAEAKFHLGENSDPIEDLDRAIKLRPDYVEAFLTRARTYERIGFTAEALRDYQRVVELAPRTPDAWNYIAWQHFYGQEWDAAIAAAAKELEIAPGNPDAMRAAGFARFAVADFAGAAVMLAKAADADPGESAAYALFVRHYALLRTGGADQRLATTWESWKDEPWVQALAKFILGKVSEDDLEKAAQDTPDDGVMAGRACEMHFYVGLARKHAGDKSTARLRFQSAVHTEQRGYVEYALAEAELHRP